MSLTSGTEVGDIRKSIEDCKNLIEMKSMRVLPDLREQTTEAYIVYSRGWVTYKSTCSPFLHLGAVCIMGWGYPIGSR